MLSFKRLSENSKCIAIIYDTKKERTKEVIYLTKLKRGITYDQGDFLEKLKKYTVDEGEDEEFDNEIKLKDGYEFQPTCALEFTREYSRFVNYIVGKSGSGKSFYTSVYVEKYHLLHPQNKIYYISNNPLSNDISYSQELQDVIEEIDLNTINTVIDFTKFRNCLLIFDDVIDVAVSLDPNLVADEIIAEKAKSTRNQSINLTLKDKDYIEKRVAKKEKSTKEYITKSLENLMNLARKNYISMIITEHKMFTGKKTSNDIISESHNITLFPYVNVSDLQLKEFLMQKVSFDKDQAREIVNNDFYEFDFLNIITDGVKGYITNDKLKIFPKKKK